MAQPTLDVLLAGINTEHDRREVDLVPCDLEDVAQGRRIGLLAGPELPCRVSRWGCPEPPLGRWSDFGDPFGGNGQSMLRRCAGPKVPSEFRMDRHDAAGELLGCTRGLMQVDAAPLVGPPGPERRDGMRLCGGFSLAEESHGGSVSLPAPA